MGAAPTVRERVPPLETRWPVVWEAVVSTMVRPALAERVAEEMAEEVTASAHWTNVL